MSNSPPVKTILILAANPNSTLRLRLDEEVREVEEGLRRASKREQFRLEQKWAVRQRDFYRAILDYQPQFVHFCGHGTGVDGIILEDELGQPVLVRADVLSSMFKLFATKGVECVLLNACYSEVQAEAISQHVNYVIGMNSTVGDKAAVAFAVAFYDAIAAGEQVDFAYQLGCSQLMQYLEHQTPVLKKREHTPTIALPKIEVIPPNPYQGLAAFGEEDAVFFFGRETFVNGLFEAIHKQPLVAVIGPSGSGKSSVVFAGLLPRLRSQGSWLIETFRPSNQPFYQIASALVRLLEPEAGETQQLRSAAGLAADMQQDKVTLHQVVSRIVERNSGKRLLLVADQFEELYTLCQNKEEQERFADALLAAVRDHNLTLVFTLRADFYGYVLSYRPFRDALQQFTSQLLSSMSREELQQVISQPAQKLEVWLEDGLTERILDDVRQEPGNLPLLEFALTQLWEKQQNRVLTHQAYEKIGGVKKALVNHAERIYNQLSQIQQKQAQHVFLQLVHLNIRTESTRRLATRTEIGDENWELVTYLASYQARLVVTGRNDKSNEDTVEVVHEALIREWQRLRQWIDANRDQLRQQRKIEESALEWWSKGKSKDYLLQGKQLEEAHLFQQVYVGKFALSDLARNFIQQSSRQRQKNRLYFLGFSLIVSCLAFFVFVDVNKIRRERLQYIVKTNRGLERIQALQELVKAGVNLDKLDISLTELNGINLAGAYLNRADFNGAKLKNVNLTTAYLNHTVFGGADLSGADLSGADFKGANLHNANFSNADLSGANLSYINLHGVNFSNAYLNGTSFNGAYLVNGNLRNANLRGANLRGADLNGTNLSNANLSDTNLSDADLSDTNLQGTNFNNANLNRIDLSKAVLSGANLIEADLRNANFNRTNLKDANLSDADLSGATLRNANFNRTNLKDADLSGATLSNTDLSTARLCKTVMPDGTIFKPNCED